MSQTGRHRKKRPARLRLVALATAVVLTVGIAAVYTATQLRSDPTTGDVQARAQAKPLPSPEATVRRVPSPAVGTPEKVMVPIRGEGTFQLADGRTERTGVGNLVTYRVEVERGLSEPPDRFAQAVDATLADKRGWISRGWAVQRDPEAATRIVLATPATVDRLCAPLATAGEVSCRNGNDVVINAVRWAEGAPSYDGDLAAYRTYLINHEFGHRLGLGHRSCPRQGSPAPVMLQQTRGLQGCDINPWP